MSDRLPLDPWPYRNLYISGRIRSLDYSPSDAVHYVFNPRSGYSQDEADYA